MPRVMKSGRVVVILRGKYAGKKGVIVKAYEDGSDSKRFGHALVVGIARYPKKLRKRMSQETMEKKARLSTFVKLINLNHMMPTRYSVDFDLKKLNVKEELEEGEAETVEMTLDAANVSDPAKKKGIKVALKQIFEENYFQQDQRKTSKATEAVQYFYKKLRF